MRICIVGKYPPIEGGVSSSTYWLAYALAARGHEIHVVTNADEVEDRYRMQLGPADAEMLQPRFAATGGRVQVHHVEGFGRRSMAHIPVANPYVSRIASLATDVVRRHRCEVIFAYYFEPYGVSAWLAARWTGRPLIIKHAGSDLDRLALVPDLATTYKEILTSADAVVTRPYLIGRFVGMGVAPQRIVVGPQHALPPAFFRPDGEILDIDAVARCDGAGQPPQPLDITRPTIGVYGKVGEAKGTFDLIRALERLAAEGRPVNFVAMVGEPAGEVLRPAVERAGLADRTTILPFLPNWRVPSFIRACTAVCFLERDFPVAIHGPMLAREVMSCGTCLVVSGEIAEKQGNRAKLEPGANLLVVSDPKDANELAGALRLIADDPQRARQIGTAGARLVGSANDVEAFATEWEAVLGRFLRAPGETAVGGGRPGPRGRPSAENALEWAVPSLLQYLRGRWPGIVEDFLATGPSGDQAATALSFCAFVAGQLSEEADGGEPVLRDALRYQAARIRAGYHAADAEPPFAVVDQLAGRTVTEADAGPLHPVRSNHIWVEEFDYDVAGLFPPRTDIETPPVGTLEHLDGVPAHHLVVAFLRTPNLIPRELALNNATLELLGRCDGRRSTTDVVTETVQAFGAGDDPAAREPVVAALDQLYHLGVIVFGVPDPVWGWRKGIRSDLSAIPALPRPRAATPRR